MQYQATTAEDYVAQIPEDRQAVFMSLRQTILNNLPKGFEEGISYGMIGYVVPHRLYPDGYHCDPKIPLPFMSIASQKNSINLYHMGIYAKPDLYDWFVAEYPKHSGRKLDMGKSCIRFKKIDDIPLDLIAQLCTKMTVDEWIDTYKAAFRK